ncbi:acyl-CoA carboxylase subunit epsilon [Rhodococcus sp. NPDC049939]|uniref:acyl-CoA carboxylase subunit epsilon n=1 Tax=Rhodococcus sp. NPDC049939 TaxID=3155511 RepID=UPI0033EADD5E
MTAITEEVVPETESDAVAAMAQSIDGSAADAALSGSAPTSLPDGTEDDSADVAEPFLKVVKGSPTPDEVAALVAVLSAMAAAGGVEQGPQLPPETWGAPTAMHRTSMPFSPYSFTSVSMFRR